MPTAAEIVNSARQALGTKYVWGGNSLTRGVDCSGLVQQVFLQHGIALPRVTYDQINTGHSVPIDKLYAGDLVFFDTDRKRQGPDHVGIYLGSGKFIHAPRPGQSVKISSLADSYYQDRWMGGRRVQGVTGGGAVSMDGLDVAQPKLESTELAERYGMSYAFFKSEPELMKLLKEATREQWTADRFTGSLKSTKWWRESSKSAREAQVLAKTDPATFKAQLSAQRVMIQQAAVKLGAILTNRQLDKAARDSLAYAWNEEKLQSFLGGYIKFTENHSLLGMAGTAAKQIAGMAYDAGVRVSEQAVKNYAQYVVKGVSSMEDVQTEIRQQAAGAYPAFVEQIEAGASVRDIAQPYIQMMSEELGIPDTDIDLFTPQVKDAMGRRDDKGNPSPMNLTDFRVLVRKDPRWKQAPTAINQAMQVGRQVLADMGLAPEVSRG
ncbi:C40 family peptidase [Streptomyces halobius]|uniref:C40 family peptidase n=1 Tax=Streptomyces halobius TaxID=2879846 RepID=A0ABY4M2K3_9ACTN|nr:C40 family peptidase [Streptomyces halobius]UQA91637.1 C40 family peptidase [Streptomyces halobius]